jgi:LEA14-like dessication related protein
LNDFGMTKRSLILASLLTGLCIALALVTLSMYGCTALQQRLNIVNPSYSLRNVDPHLNLALPPSMDFDLTVGVDNPNAVGLRLDQFDFNLLVNGNNIANGTSFDRIQIPARGIGDVRLRTHVSYDNAKAIFREVTDLIQGNRARYEIRGNAAYDTPVGRLTFPVSVMR